MLEYVVNCFSMLVIFQMHWPPRAETVTVMSGRQIRVARARSDACGGVGCARFTFDELCDQPYGASDYLAIAEHYGVLLIENIPRFSIDKNRNQMRRFITLLDVIYDANVRLICSAEAEPHDLFISDKPKAGMILKQLDSQLEPVSLLAWFSSTFHSKSSDVRCFCFWNP